MQAPRLLLVSFHFPPHNAIAAVRVGKLAKFLLAKGWDVRVLTARGDEPETLPLEIPPERVLRTAWIDIDELVDRYLLGWRSAFAGRSGAAPDAAPAPRAPIGEVIGGLSQMRSTIVRWPDRRRGWVPVGLRESRGWLDGWKPDLIYASAPPHSTALLAHRLARRLGVPWVAEFRDLWTDNPYYEFPAWRRRLETWWERRVLNSAAALVTVSDTWRGWLEAKYGRPVTVAMNGFVPEDLPTGVPFPARTGDRLRILYTGSIYPKYRDPSPLFEAISRLGAEGTQVAVEFIGANVDTVRGLAEQSGVTGQVTISPAIPYRDALRRQCEADILLHLQWNDPKEAGTISGKLFEYIGARRPTLGIGYDGGEVASILHARSAGVVLNDPAAIADQLRIWLAQKRDKGVPPIPAEALGGLSRDEQFAHVLSSLRRVLAPLPADGPRRYGAPADPTGMTSSPHFRPVRVDPAAPPLFCVVVDVEEEFNWRAPFSRDAHGTLALRRLPEVQQVFERHRICPAYLVDYPVISSSYGSGLLRELAQEGRCELGAQLHPWVNPPFDEQVSARNSFPGNLAAPIERAKLLRLTEAIEATAGVRPRIYKAGRYGLGPNTADLLEEFGYDVDTSLLPESDLRFASGPDFSCFRFQPFWFGRERRLLELPVTRSFDGIMRQAGREVFRWVGAETSVRNLVRGALAEFRLVDRITLSPEGQTLEEMKRIARRLVADGQRILTLSFHSSSLDPGHTPYVRSERELAQFHQKLEGFIEYATGELRAEFTSPLALYRLLAAKAAQPAAVEPAPMLDRIVPAPHR